MSDGLNRKNHYVPLNSILKAYEDSWQQGTTSNLNHDSTRFIGWNYVTGIYIEPGKAYVTNTMGRKFVTLIKTSIAIKLSN